MKNKELLLDVSELEAPKPLLEALRAMQKLQDDEVLVFRHRIYPCKLEEQVKKFGLQKEIVKNEPNFFEMRIWR